MPAKRTAPALKFSNTSIAKLPFSPSKTSQITYRDTEFSGLYLIVSASRKVFRLNARLARLGKNRNFQIGRFPDITVEMARIKARDYLQKIAQGVDPAEELEAERAKDARQAVTLREARDEYVKTKISAGTMRQSTADAKYFYDFNLYAKDLIDLPLTKITGDLVEQAIVKLRDEAASKGKSRDVSLRIFLRALSAVLNFANEKYSTESTPDRPGQALYVKLPTRKVQNLGLLRKSKPRERALTTKELPVFYRYLFERSAFVSAGQTSSDFFIFALLTGAREGEIKKLEWRDVADLDGKATVLFRDTKTHDNRLIPIGPKLAELLRRRQRILQLSGYRGPFVFPGSGKSGHFEEPKNLIYNFLKLNRDFNHFSIHDLRRTFASHGRTEVVGGDPLIVSTLAGHKDRKNTTEKHYTVIGAEINSVLRDSMNSIESALLLKCEHAKVDASFNELPRDRD